MNLSATEMRTSATAMTTVRRLVCLAATLLLLAGCAATTAINTQAALELHVTDSGRVLLNDDEYEIERLPTALRKLGVPPRQSLLIHVKNQEDRPLMVRISAALRNAGFSRFIFAGTQHAESNVLDPSQKRPSPPATNRQPPLRRKR